MGFDHLRSYCNFSNQVSFSLCFFVIQSIAVMEELQASIESMARQMSNLHFAVQQLKEKEREAREKITELQAVITSQEIDLPHVEQSHEYLTGEVSQGGH